MVRGVVFDMDGVIADTEPVHTLSWEILFTRMGLAAPKGYFDRFVGICDTDSVPMVNRDLGLRLDVEGTISRRLDIFAELIVERGLTPNPGFREFHRRCRDAALPVGVATGSWRRTVDVVLKAVSAHLDPDPAGRAFDIVVTRDDVTRPKPDPESYRTACLRLNRDPRECLAVEDSPSGIASAVDAGLHCIALSTPYFDRPALARAHRVIDALTELEQVPLGRR